MESSNDPEPKNWIPTSFSSAPDLTEDDSLSSYHSAKSPGSTAVDLQSDEQSFDAISRHKLNLTLISSTTSNDQTSPKSPRVPGMSMFEEDTRSSWSVEPKPTQIKGTSLDEDSQNSVYSLKSSNVTQNNEEPSPEKEFQTSELDKETSTVLSQENPVLELDTFNDHLNSPKLPEGEEPVFEAPKEMKPEESSITEDIEEKVAVEAPIVWNVDSVSSDKRNEDIEEKVADVAPSVWNEDSVSFDKKNEDIEEKVADVAPSVWNVDSVSSDKKNEDNIAVEAPSLWNVDSESCYKQNEDIEKKVAVEPPSVWNMDSVSSDKKNEDIEEKAAVEAPSVWNMDSVSSDKKNEDIEEKVAVESSSVWNVDSVSSHKAEIETKEEIPMNEDLHNEKVLENSMEGVTTTQCSSVWNLQENNKDNVEAMEVPMDEDSQMSNSSYKSANKSFDSSNIEPTPSAKEPKLMSGALDEESQCSIMSQKSHSSQKSVKRQRFSDDETNGTTFLPENLFEYMWPQDNGEFYLLQEQICDYLNVKSFKRKYPDLARRSVEMDEKQFLKEKGVVTEVQCDLGLTALKSEEVLELMSKDYPDHYKDYIKILREKEKQSITEKHKEFIATNSDKTKMVDLVKKAVQSAAEYNAHLNQERREERRSCMDLQTYTIHYPVKKSQKPKPKTKPGKYPVALLPGQFQDYYKKYTSDELKYLPLNTVLYGPMKELQSTTALSDGSHSDSDDSSISEGSDSSSQGTPDDSSSSSDKNENGQVPSVNNNVSHENAYHPKVKPNANCKVCKKGPENKNGKPEELVHCSECDNSAHPSCIELTTEVVNVLKTYPWQCMDCKVCSHCSDPNDEDKMLFCDFCDRGYHTFCVGLKNLPQGKWVCRLCGSCSICGVTKPGPETSKAQWLYDSSKGVVELDANKRPKIMCQSCFRKKR